MNKTTRNSGSSRVRYYISGIAILILVSAVYLGYERTTYEVETFEAIKGELIVDVRVSGELKARRSKQIYGPKITVVELKIAKLVPEGEFVEEGDYLIQFDTTELENRLFDYEVDLALKDLELEALLAKQKTDSVRTFNQLLKDSLSYELAKMQAIESLFEAELLKRKDQINLQKKEFGLRDRIDEIEKDKLKNIEEINKKRIAIQRNQKLVDDYTKQLKEMTVYSPYSGLVVYEKIATGPGRTEKIKEGTSGIYYRNALIQLPDLSEMLVEVQVNEFDVSKIKPGNEVIVTVDANGNVYYGTVSHVAILAQKGLPGPFAVSEKKLNTYKTEISLKNTDNDGSLKPGMTAACRIVTDRLQDVVYIPVQSVFETEDESFVYIKESGKFKKATVATGVQNKDFIVIKEGLEPGQHVALLDPFSKFKGIGGEIKEKATKPAPAKSGTVEQRISAAPVVIIR